MYIILLCILGPSQLCYHTWYLHRPTMENRHHHNQGRATGGNRAPPPVSRDSKASRYAQIMPTGQSHSQGRHLGPGFRRRGGKGSPDVSGFHLSGDWEGLRAIEVVGDPAQGLGAESLEFRGPEVGAGSV